MDRYQLIIDLGEEGDVLPASEKNESNLIDGCQSRVWIVCDQQADGTLVFRGESDALIVKGLVCLLLPRGERPHARGDSRCRSLFYPENRAGRKSFADALERFARHDQAHQGLCRCAQRLKPTRLLQSAALRRANACFSPTGNRIFGGRKCFSEKKSPENLAKPNECTTFALANAKEVLLLERYPPKTIGV